MQDNELTALNGGGAIIDMSSCLQVLDLHNNHLEKLPDEIGTLKQLKVSIILYIFISFCTVLYHFPRERERERERK